MAATVQILYGDAALFHSGAPNRMSTSYLGEIDSVEGITSAKGFDVFKPKCKLVKVCDPIPADANVLAALTGILDGPISALPSDGPSWRAVKLLQQEVEQLHVTHRDNKAAIDYLLEHVAALAQKVQDNEYAIGEHEGEIRQLLQDAKQQILDSFNLQDGDVNQTILVQHFQALESALQQMQETVKQSPTLNADTDPQFAKYVKEVQNLAREVAQLKSTRAARGSLSSYTGYSPTPGHGISPAGTPQEASSIFRNAEVSSVTSPELVLNPTYKGQLSTILDSDPSMQATPDARSKAKSTIQAAQAARKQAEAVVQASRDQEGISRAKINELASMTKRATKKGKAGKA